MARKEPFELVDEIPSLFFRQRIKIWYDDFTGEFYPPEQPIYNKRIHESYSLHYVIDGHGYFGIGEDEAMHLSAGDMFYIPPRAVMRYYPDKKDPWKICGFSLNGAEIGRFFSRLGFSGAAMQKRTDVTDKIGQIILSCIEAHREQTVGYYDLLGCFCTVFSLLENVCRVQNIREDTTAIYAERAKEYLEMHYSDPTLRIADLAQEMNLSHPYLCRVFKKHAGISAEAYLRQFRMSVAERLLREQRYTVCETAMLCGYTDPAQFSRMYKAAHGISPRQAAKKE